MGRDADHTRPVLIDRALSAASALRDDGQVHEAGLLFRQVMDADPSNGAAREAIAEEAPTAEPSPRRPLPRRLARRYARPAIEALAQRPRVWKYRVLSTCPRLSGSPVAL